MPVVWSDSHRLHDPGGEIWVGVRTPGTELPERAERIRAALAEHDARFVDARAQPDDALTSVHDRELAEHLSGAWSAWEEAGLPEDPGQDRVVPYLFPHPDLFSGRPVHTGHRRHGPRGPVRLRHDDADRAGHLGGGPGGARLGGHRGRAGAGRGAGGIRVHAPARTPRHPQLRSAAPAT